MTTPSNILHLFHRDRSYFISKIIISNVIQSSRASGKMIFFPSSIIFLLDKDNIGQCHYYLPTAYRRVQQNTLAIANYFCNSVHGEVEYTPSSHRFFYQLDLYFIKMLSARNRMFSYYCIFCSSSSDEKKGVKHVHIPILTA